jgi:tRNA modification GTPase
VTLLDTAGIRETDDPVEMEGVRRAQARAETADLVLWVVDARERGQNRAKSAGKAGNGPPKWLIHNKTDLVEGKTERNESKITNRAKNENGSISVKNQLRKTNESEIYKNDRGFKISAVTGEGFDVLLGCLAAHAEAFLGGGEPTVITRQRHRHALEECLAALKRAQSGEVMKHEDLLAIELRIAANALGRLTGRVDVEDILDVIFRDFCIGK